ncbi:unnamed protein product [Mytilus coruscus]|uniref:Transposase Tc1-like domain-containing protein n=1 Tax=Mytilus coruscus TaxID=42192 RepID=A0A6J8AEL6_MYTCO|nr:unnamed protein product [Mytilus coruscus]
MNSLSHVDFLLKYQLFDENYQFHRNNGQSRRQNQTRNRSTEKVANTIQAITGILRTRGHNISRHSVRYWLRAYDRGFISELGVHVQPKQRTFRKVSERDAELIKELIKSDFSMSSKQIHKALVADGANMSLSLTKIAIDAAGFTHSRPRYGQMVRRANRPKRVDFCQHLIDENDDFADIIFSDESSIQTFKIRPIITERKILLNGSWKARNIH